MTEYLVPRACREEHEKRFDEPRALASFRALPSYVLLGEPGAGKTCAFMREVEESGGHYVRARDFVELPIPSNAHGKPLFIDGLDEMRAGGSEGRTGLGDIRRRLAELGMPSFRLSCREADWREAADRSDLERMVPDGRVAVLHLEPLSAEDISNILRNKFAIPKSEDFIAEAGRGGVADLLRNPQTLKLMVEATAGGSWPKSRAETYELACRQLIREENDQHRLATRKRQVPPERLLDAAGYLCALHLLAGIDGFVLDPANGSSRSFPVDYLNTPDGLPLLGAIGTRLFEGHGYRAPTHRSIAEYLGARFLARQILGSALPLGRVQALMSGADGGIIAELRGLHAWLAVHCPHDRHRFIERDPLGVMLHGDVRSFSVTEKRWLLEQLQREAKRFGGLPWSNWSSPPFAALGTTDMAPVFRELLASTSRTEADQWVLEVALEAIRHGEPLPELDTLLLSLARDRDRWPMLRTDALRAYFAQGNHRPTEAIALLEDIRAGRVEDRDDELAGTLLDQLYPAHLTAPQTIEHLHTRKDANLIGAYLMFWQHEFPDRTPPEDLPGLLDRLHAMAPIANRALEADVIQTAVGRLLLNALIHHGEGIEPRRLYEWLGIGLDEHQLSWLDHDEKQEIAQWLSAHPETLKALMLVAAADAGEDEKARFRWRRNLDRLQGATWPEEAGYWLYEWALDGQAADEVARGFFQEAFLFLEWAPAKHGLSLEMFEDAAVRQPRLQSALDEMRAWKIEDWRVEDAQHKREHDAKRRTEKDEWLAHLRKHLDEIQKGTAPATVLHDIAMTYEGHLHFGKGETPDERLASAFDGDEPLIAAAKSGLRQCIYRNDLPSVKDIVKSDLNNRFHYIRPACLLGMSLLFNEAPQRLMELSDDILGRMLAFRATWAREHEPDWLPALAAVRPQVLIDIALKVIPPQLKGQKGSVAWLHELGTDPAWREIAVAVLPKLLTGYPIRAAEKSLHSLEYLLKAALRWLSSTELASIIDAKLTTSHMTIKQRGLWLSAATLLIPEKYTEPIAIFVGKDQVRALALADFLANRRDPVPYAEHLPWRTVGLLVELIAPIRGPERPVGGHRVTREMNAADTARNLVGRLGASPNETAGKEIVRLLALKALVRWHGELKRALREHLAAKREAGYHRPTVEEVCHALANGDPASASDLAALLAQHLRDIARDDRDGNTTGYLRYWKPDSYGRPNTPNPEPYCRDRLLELLKEKLRPTNVRVEPEGESKENSRADILATVGGERGFKVPIELKHDYHKHIWRAMHEQLMAEYACAPGADGHGIYLVFWFGGTDIPAPIDGGNKPRSASELEDRLRSLLDSDERRRIEVIVMDCAPVLSAK